jgi:hypothetical protein
MACNVAMNAPAVVQGVGDDQAVGSDKHVARLRPQRTLRSMHIQLLTELQKSGFGTNSSLNQCA